MRNVQDTLDEAVRQFGLPGATAAVALPDGTLASFAAGVADRELGIAMVPQSRMLAASIGKTFVGATAVALEADGQLILDSPISVWLGNRAWFSRLPNGPRITVRHLLNHTAGLPDHVHDAAFAETVAAHWRERGTAFTPEELVTFILDEEALFAPGQGWAYSDTGYVLLGMIIEIITKQTYYEIIRARFLEPLELTSTAPSNRRELPGLVPGYTLPSNPFGFPEKTTTSPGVMAWNPAVEWTGGGLVSNSGDLAAWGKALFEGHALDVPYLHELLRGVPVDISNPSICYGAGVAIYTETLLGPAYGHNGLIPGYTSSLRYYPEHGIAIAFQINADIDAADRSPSFVGELEIRLAETVVSAIMADHQSDSHATSEHSPLRAARTNCSPQQ